MSREITIFNNETGKFTKRPAETMSEVFGGNGYHGGDRLADVESARSAANTAKPFMDIAVDLYDSHMRGWLMGDRETKDDRQMVASLPQLEYLVKYAQHKSDRAVDFGQELALTPNEGAMLEAYQAEIELQEVVGRCRPDYLADTTGLQAAIDKTEKMISSTEDTDERHRLKEMANKLVRYQESFMYDDDISRKEFNVSADNASYLLNEAATAGSEDVLSNKAVSIGDIKKETQMIREKVAMLDFLSSLDQPVQDESKSAYKGLSPEELAAAREQVANIHTNSGENAPTSVELSDVWMERDRQVDTWVEEHGTNLTPEAVELAGQYLIKSVEALIRQMTRGREANPSLGDARYSANLAGVFGSSLSLQSIAGIHEIIAKAYLKSNKSGVRELSNIDYAKLRLRETGVVLGVDLKGIAGFESTFG